MPKLVKRLVGNTFQITWVNSGVTPSSILATVYDGSETLVSSASMTSSGNGHYYANYTPNTPGFHVAETVAVINSNDYKKRVYFRVVTQETD